MLLQEALPGLTLIGAAAAMTGAYLVARPSTTATPAPLSQLSRLAARRISRPRGALASAAAPLTTA
jgi:hypothetical protein